MPDFSPIPYRPPLELEPGSVEITNAIFRGGRALRFQIDNTAVAACFSVTGAQRIKPAAWALLNTPHGSARVVLDAVGFLPTMGALLDAPLPEALPSDLAAAVVELIVSSVDFPGVTVDSAGLGEPPTDGDDDSWQLPVQVDSEDGRPLAAGLVQCGQPVAEALARALESAPPGQAQPALEPDAVGRVQFASIQIALEEFEQLQPLDILVLGAYGLGGKVPIRLFFSPGVYFFGSIDGEVIAMNTQENEAAAPQDPASNQNARVDLDKLPVRVSFEVGSVTVTLSELKAMAEGTVVELPAPLDSPIVLRANGREIGTGSLLRVGDHLGVRILELGASQPEREAP